MPCRINTVRNTIAQRSSSGFCFLQSPDAPKVRTPNPILQIGTAIMTDLSDATLVYQLFCKHHCWSASIVVTEHVEHSSAIDGTEHVFCFTQAIRERLLTKHDLTRLRCLDCYGRVHITRRADVDYVNILPLKNLLPRG